MVFDVLIIGGGVSGMSAAISLGSAKEFPFAKDKAIGIIAHQRSSSLQNALFNNVIGLTPGTLGSNIMTEGIEQIKTLYPHVEIIENEKVLSIEENEFITVNSNKNTYQAKKIIIAVGPKNFAIKGLESFEEKHEKLDPEKERTQLKNTNHVVKENIYVTGVLAGHRSQYAIALGSGAMVAMDILSEWNDGKPVKVHDKITPQ